MAGRGRRHAFGDPRRPPDTDRARDRRPRSRTRTARAPLRGGTRPRRRRRADAGGGGDVPGRARGGADRAPTRCADRRDRSERRALRRDVGARFRTLGAVDGGLRAGGRRVPGRAATLGAPNPAHVVPDGAQPAFATRRRRCGRGRARRRDRDRARARTPRRARRGVDPLSLARQRERFEHPERDLTARLGRSEAEPARLGRRRVHGAHHGGKGRLLARDRARPVPGRRLGPELRPACRRRIFPGRPTHRAREWSTQPSTSARSTRVGFRPRTARSTSTSRDPRCFPDRRRCSSTSRSPASPTTCSRRSPTPPRRCSRR